MISTAASAPRASPRGASGTCEYAQTVSVPAGERVGSALFICPTSTNGRAGTSPCASSAPYRVAASMLVQTCTVPARCASGARHGIGPESAQSTLNVRVVVLEAVERADERGGEVLLADEALVQRGRADVGEHGATGVDGRAVGERHRDGTAVADDDAR